MKKVYYFGSDTSIFDSLEGLSKIKKSFVIKRIDNTTKKNLKDTVLILDDGFEDFIRLTKYYSKK